MSLQLTWLSIYTLRFHSGHSCIPTNLAQQKLITQTCAGPGNYLLLSGDSNSSLCLQECGNNDCGIGSNGLLLAADICDQRVSQLWAVSGSSNQLQNAGTGRCITVQADGNLTMATCSGKAAAQASAWMYCCQQVYGPN